MRRRRGPAEESLDTLLEQRTKLAGDLERQETTLAGARSAVREAREHEAAAVLDDSDPADAREHRHAAKAALVAAAGDLDVLRRAIAMLDERLEAKRKELRVEEFAQIRAAYRKHRGECNRIVAEQNDALADAVRLQSELDETRAAATAQQDLARTFTGDQHLTFDCEDEPARPAGLEKLVEEITAGPRRPRAKAQREAAALKRQRDHRLAADANRLVEKAGEYPPGPSRDRELAKLPEPLRSQTLERMERAREERRAAIVSVHGSAEGSGRLERIR